MHLYCMSKVDRPYILAEDPGERTLVLREVRTRWVQTTSDPGPGSEIVIGPSGHRRLAKLISVQSRHETSEFRLVIEIIILLLMLEKQALVSEGTGDDLAGDPDIGDVLNAARLPASVRHIPRHHREEDRALGDLLQLLCERNLNVPVVFALVGPESFQIRVGYEP